MNWSHAHRAAVMGVSLTVVACLTLTAAAGEKASLSNPFFAYCVGIGTGKADATLGAQLELPKMLEELGYDGMAYVGLAGAGEMLEALEERGQKLFAVYTPLNVEPEGPGYDPQIKDLIPKLQGHGTIVWLVVNSKTYKPSSTDGDGRAVALLREIADLAKQYGVGVSLYPHRGAYAERMEDVVRLAEKTERENIGVTFTLCHFMATDDVKNLDRVLAMARPHLTMATVNGTSGYDPQDRAGWILTLDEGSYDVSQVLKTLRELDYRGPIGMIVYGIKGDRREILARSIQGWKKHAAKAAAGGTE